VSRKISTHLENAAMVFGFRKQSSRLNAMEPGFRVTVSVQTFAVPSGRSLFFAA
jgi:hypothetical protein